MLTDSFDEWEREFSDMPEPEVVDFSKMSTPQLVAEQQRVLERLGELKEVLSSSTEEGRSLHSQRTAIQVEINKRGRR